jgi:hypothetical protein
MSIVKKVAKTGGKNADDEFGSSDDEDEDEDKYADAADAVGQKLDTKTRITVRNLRIREDTAKYLINLDPESAYYDPKTRSMRDAPVKNVAPQDVSSCTTWCHCQLTLFAPRRLLQEKTLPELLERPQSLQNCNSSLGKPTSGATTSMFMPTQLKVNYCINNSRRRKRNCRIAQRSRSYPSMGVKNTCKKLHASYCRDKQRSMSSTRKPVLL